MSLTMRAISNIRTLTSSEPFFRDLRAELSQGDIIANVPRGFVDDTAVCRVEGGQQYGRAKYEPADRKTNPPAFERKSGHDSIHLSVAIGFAMVLWPDCAIDGFGNKAREGGHNISLDKMFAGVAPLVAMSNYKSCRARNIKAVTRPSLFYIPAFPEFDIPESVADLRRILPIKQSILINARVASVSDLVRDQLVPHLTWFFTEHRLGDHVGCPSCGAEIDLRNLIRLPDA